MYSLIPRNQEEEEEEEMTTMNRKKSSKRQTNINSNPIKSNSNYFKKYNTLLYDMRSLFKQSKMYDLIIQAPITLINNINQKVDDLKQFKVHKLVLSMRSEVFETMFKNNNFDSHSSQSSSSVTLFNINDFDANVVEMFLNYLYTDSLQINYKNLKILKGNDESVNNCENRFVDFFLIELFRIADKYCVYHLKEVCESELVKSIELETVVELLILSHLHDAFKLKRKCFQFLIQKMSKVVQHSSWIQLENNYPNLIAETFKILCLLKNEN
jgi:hypothetical protein